MALVLWEGFRWPLPIIVFLFSPLPKLLYMLQLCIQETEWVNEQIVHMQHETLKRTFINGFQFITVQLRNCSSFTNQVILDLGKLSHRRYSQDIVKQAKKLDISQQSWLNTYSMKKKTHNRYERSLDARKWCQNIHAGLTSLGVDLEADAELSPNQASSTSLAYSFIRSSTAHPREAVWAVFVIDICLSIGKKPWKVWCDLPSLPLK